MIRYLYNPPVLVKTIFKDFIWDSLNGKILLTFDDGPLEKTTETILKTLNKHRLKAVFFCVGNNLIRNTGLTGEILGEGHTIGNHTFNHRQITGISGDELKKEIFSLNKWMEDKFGYNVKYFRPPHGKFNLRLNRTLKQKNMVNVMWSLLTYDFKSDIKLFKNIFDNYMKNNSLVVLHDSLKTGTIIPETVEYLIERAASNGFLIGEPAECLK